MCYQTWYLSFFHKKCVDVPNFELHRGLLVLIDAVVQKRFVKNMFLEVSENSQENTCGRVSFLIKLQALGQQVYLKRDSGTDCLPVNFVKFLRGPFLQNTSGGWFYR